MRKRTEGGCEEGWEGMEDVWGRREGSEGGEEGGGKTRGRRNGRREAGVVSLQSRYNRPLALAVCLISLSHVRTAHCLACPTRAIFEGVSFSIRGRFSRFHCCTLRFHGTDLTYSREAKFATRITKVSIRCDSLSTECIENASRQWMALTHFQTCSSKLMLNDNLILSVSHLNNIVSLSFGAHAHPIWKHSLPIVKHVRFAKHWHITHATGTECAKIIYDWIAIRSSWHGLLCFQSRASTHRNCLLAGRHSNLNPSRRRPPPHRESRPKCNYESVLSSTSCNISHASAINVEPWP